MSILWFLRGHICLGRFRSTFNQLKLPIIDRASTIEIYRLSDDEITTVNIRDRYQTFISAPIGNELLAAIRGTLIIPPLSSVSIRARSS